MLCLLLVCLASAVAFAILGLLLASISSKGERPGIAVMCVVCAVATVTIVAHDMAYGSCYGIPERPRVASSQHGHPTHQRAKQGAPKNNGPVTDDNGGSSPALDGLTNPSSPFYPVFTGSGPGMP